MEKLTQVLGIVGSPRKKGNTNALVEAVLAGARQAGAHTRKIFLTDLNIQYCNACDHCQNRGNCVHEDGMDQVLELMRQCQVWVLGTPIYWWGPTAQMKTFVDRWYQDVEGLRALTGRQVVLVVPFADTVPATAQHAIGMFQDGLSYLRKEIVEIITAPGLGDISDAERHPDLISAAMSTGQRVALKA